MEAVELSELMTSWSLKGYLGWCALCLTILFIFRRSDFLLPQLLSRGRYHHVYSFRTYPIYCQSLYANICRHYSLLSSYRAL